VDSCDRRQKLQQQQTCTAAAAMFRQQGRSMHRQQGIPHTCTQSSCHMLVRRQQHALQLFEHNSLQWHTPQAQLTTKCYLARQAVSLLKHILLLHNQLRSLFLLLLLPAVCGSSLLLVRSTKVREC
jgi:hypothetical protein